MLHQARLQKEDKLKKREASYKKKKWNKYQERSRALRDATGVNGFASLYRVLGLPERKLASIKEIKRAYRRSALKYHPDKNPDDEDAASKFEEVKAAYDLLLEVPPPPPPPTHPPRHPPTPSHTHNHSHRHNTPTPPCASQGIENGNIEGMSVFSAGEIAAAGTYKPPAPTAQAASSDTAAKVDPSWDNSNSAN